MAADPVRDEAERLVAAAIAAVSMAARGLGGGQSSFANGSAECCVCPVCRVISAMRDPSPEVAERLATGAGDVAAAVAHLLRTLSRSGAEPGHGGPAEPPSGDTGRPDSAAGPDPWREATRAAPDAPAPPPPRVVKKAVAKAATPAPPVKVAKVAKKAVKKASPPAGEDDE